MTRVATTQVQTATSQVSPTATLLLQSENSKHTATDASPQKQLGELNINSSFARIVHQTDRYGKPQPILTSFRPAFRVGSSAMKLRGSFRNIFANIWSIQGHQEEQQDIPKSKVMVSSSARGTSIELRPSLLPPLSPGDSNKKCLVLDLDETLVHASFQLTDHYDFLIPVHIDGMSYQVYVCKRPGADDFLIEMAKYYEIVVYTASISKYADPLLDQLDPKGVIRHRLYREDCVQYEGNYVKDLSLLDRDISQTIIIDNSPAAYIFHPRNAIGCSSFIDDLEDCELKSIARFLTQCQDVEDVRDHLQKWDATF